MKEKVPVMYTNCLLTKGHTSSIICDLQRNSYIKIPNNLYEILTLHKGKTISEIKSFFKHKFDDIIDNYFNILINNEFVFLTSTPECFPEISLEWEEAFQITNAIIDIDDKNKFSIQNALKQLSEINCKFIQFRFYSQTSFNDLQFIINYLDFIKSNSIGIEFHLNFNETFKEKKLLNAFFNHKRVSSIILYSAKAKSIEKIDGTRYLILTNKSLKSEKNCGMIIDGLFTINIKTYTESINHNSCLNRKISIDKKGDIKNCPSMKESYGNINNDNIIDVLKNPEFTKYWKINKNEIETCKDCEFRHICTDCRAYIEKPNNIKSKPLKCGYNPYTGKWSNWEKDSTKIEAIEYYEM